MPNRETASRFYESLQAVDELQYLPRMGKPKRFVYVLNSASNPTRYYTGITSNVRARLTAHNEGRCGHTSRWRPWRIVVLVAFAREDRALDFERYLKSGSGCAFAARHFR